MKNLFKKNRNLGRSGVEIEDHIFSVTETEIDRMEIPLERKKVNFFWWLAFLTLVVIFGKVFYLNVIMGEHYKGISKGNSLRSLKIKAPRGKIYDQSNVLLANNFPSMDAVAVPADIFQEEKEYFSVLNRLENILKINSADLNAKLEGADRQTYSAILLKENISQEEALMLEEQKKNLPGVMVERTSVRDYVYGPIFSHLLGYEGKINAEEIKSNPDYSMTDYIGKNGLEKYYESYLRGQYGSIQVEVDSLGNIKKERGVIPAVPGNNLILNINSELQKKIFDSLSAVLENTESKTAAAVAIDPRDGSVRALVSLPSFDNNLFSRKISKEDYATLVNDKDKPLFNRAIAGEYPPGSTLKPLVAIAGLAEGVISETTTVGCYGGINIGSYRFGDWKNHGKDLDVRGAIAESCDTFFYAVGGGYANISGLGMSRMKKYENAFGLGRETGVDFIGEASGFIPDEQWKKEKFGESWYVGNSYHAAIGQGYVTATPLQIANYIAAVANGGTLYEPRIGKEVINQDGEKIVFEQKTIKSEIANKNVIEVVRQGMRQTIIAGTAQQLRDLPIETAGKTGTAQFGTENKTHAWFASFAPFENPELAMVILVEGGGEGHSSAVPVTKDVYGWYFGEKK